MAINLADIRSAVINYVRTQVVAGVTPFIPDVPNTINPNEEFSFDIQAKNVPAPNGMRVINITYHVTANPSSVAQLKVPANPPARAGNDPTLPVLNPGTFVSSMFLFPADNSLDPGDSDSFPGLKGKAGSLGLADIACHIHGDIDPDYLFPKNNLSENAKRQVQVV